MSFADPSGGNNTGREVPVALPTHDSRGYTVSDLEGPFTVYLYIYTYVFTHGLDAFRY